jgi:hypothetical protein
MSAATHKVTALSKRDRVLTVRLRIVHPDEHTFCVEKSCALQLIWARANPGIYDASPLGDEVPYRNLREPKWLVENAGIFIESVDLLDTANHPRGEEFDFNTASDASLPQATVAIRVTDEKWIAHIRKGATWEVALFDASTYL